MPKLRYDNGRYAKIIPCFFLFYAVLIEFAKSLILFLFHDFGYNWVEIPFNLIKSSIKKH